MIFFTINASSQEALQAWINHAALVEQIKMFGLDVFTRS